MGIHIVIHHLTWSEREVHPIEDWTYIWSNSIFLDKILVMISQNSLFLRPTRVVIFYINWTLSNPSWTMVFMILARYVMMNNCNCKNDDASRPVSSRGLCIVKSQWANAFFSNCDMYLSQNLEMYLFKIVNCICENNDSWPASSSCGMYRRRRLSCNCQTHCSQILTCICLKL